MTGSTSTPKDARFLGAAAIAVVLLCGVGPAQAQTPQADPIATCRTIVAAADRAVA